MVNERDRKNPSIIEAFRLDPNLSVDKDVHEKMLRDLQRPSRRYFYPPFRWFVRIMVVLIGITKRFLPRLGSEPLLNKLVVWFVKNLVSPEAGEYLLLHFHYEANVINFIAQNCGAEDVLEVDLKPVTLDELGEVDGGSAIKQHDINVYNLLIDLGSSDRLDLSRPKPLQELCFDALEIPAIDVEPERKRWLNLDIDTSSYMAGLFIGLFLNEEDIERAITSLQFDESMMQTLTKITGDNRFLFWAPMKFTNWHSHYYDGSQMLRWHMYVLEYAHQHLITLKQAAAADAE